ncbi:MAG: trimeric intracellular cation channel family protein [Duodenibacillus sp.]|nr:trimeric intracellular cation channel family protein [Duodenibacillus sp.]
MEIDFLLLADFIGIVGFAFAGILAAMGKKVDPVGVFVLAFTTAFGGGLMRDLIIDNRPFYWIAHEEYVWMTLGLSIVAPFVMRSLKEKLLHTLFIFSDALGLGFFVICGTAMSMKAGIGPLPSAMLGVCTAVFGGMVRDVFLNRMPLVLSDRQPYASAAFAGCWVYIGLIYSGSDETQTLWFATMLIVVVRMVCWYKDWNIVSYGRFQKKDGTLHDTEQQPKKKHPVSDDYWGPDSNRWID